METEDRKSKAEGEKMHRSSHAHLFSLQSSAFILWRPKTENRRLKGKKCTVRHTRTPSAFSLQPLTFGDRRPKIEG
ncbi:uncharacterized protein Dmul_02860 [Desulfococcus multivorans]|nr:uncharacterized protein Dmul_02860 [Desulfococcus multivorans]